MLWLIWQTEDYRQLTFHMGGLYPSKYTSLDYKGHERSLGKIRVGTPISLAIIFKCKA